MDSTKRRFRGILYLGIGMMSLIYGLNFLSEALQYHGTVPDDYLIFLIPAFGLSTITFFFGIKSFFNKNEKYND